MKSLAPKEAAPSKHLLAPRPNPGKAPLPASVANDPLEDGNVNARIAPPPPEPIYKVSPTIVTLFVLTSLKLASLPLKSLKLLCPLA